MSIFDFLKRKSSFAKATEDKKEIQKKVAEKILDKKLSFAPPLGEFRKGKGFSYEVVKEPHISEKASYLSENNKYIFKVYSNVNKTEIKRSIEGIYGVDVLSVNIIKIRAKKRRIGRTQGFKKGYNKAMVTIKEGQKIELL